MLLIHCPYCGDRARARVRATAARRTSRAPPTRRRSTDEEWARFPVHPRTTRRACTPSAGATSTAAAASSTPLRDTVERPVPRHLQGRRAAAADRRAARSRPMSDQLRIQPAAASTARSPLRFTFDGKAYERPRRRHRSPRRCSPTASIWSAARSSTTARAASSPRAPRSRTRWSASTAAAARSSPTLRATEVGALRRPRRRQPEPLADRSPSTSARSTTGCRRCSRPASTTRPSCGRAPSGTSVYEPIIRRAAGLGERADRCPTPTATSQRYAHCDVLIVGAGPAGLAAALAAGRAARA